MTGKTVTRPIWAILTTGLWLNTSLFLRNEILFKHLWVEHYRSLGLEFPSTALNGLVWLTWGFLFSGCIVVIQRRFGFWGAVLLSWTMGFVLMEIPVANLGVMPFALLPVAIPWSLAEVAVAVVIARVMTGAASPTPERGNAP